MARWTTGSATTARKRAASNCCVSAKFFGRSPRVAGKHEVGARRHIPGRLEHRGNLCHEPRLQCRYRIRLRSRPAQHILQQASLFGGGRHTLAMYWVEPTECIGNRQDAAGQARQPFEMPPNTRGKAVVPKAVGRLGVAEGVVYGRRDQRARRLEEGVPGFQPSGCVVVRDRDYPVVVLGRYQYRVQRKVRRIRLGQDEFPVRRRVGGNRHDGGRIAEVNADLRHLRALPTEGVKQC
jgi:hypothetical protein